jgi:hypothetical protein
MHYQVQETCLQKGISWTEATARNPQSRKSLPLLVLSIGILVVAQLIRVVTIILQGFYLRLANQDKIVVMVDSWFQ